MLTFDELKIEVRLTSDRDEDDRAIIYWTFRNESGDAPYGWYFLWRWPEFERAMTDNMSVHQDGYHMLMTFDEMWTFFDTDRITAVRGAIGEATCRYYRADMPRGARQKILDTVRSMIEQLERLESGRQRGHEKQTWDISKQQRKEWLDFYGQGKGKVQVEYSTDDVRNQFESFLAQYSDDDSKEAKSFKRSVEHLMQMARNETHQADETGVLKLGWDGEHSFMFFASGLTGCLIRHSSDNLWSTHT